MTAKTATKSTPKRRPKTEAKLDSETGNSKAILLSLWERIELSTKVITQGLGLQTELWAHGLRVSILDPTDAEIEEFELVRMGPGNWGWPPQKNHLILGQETGLRFTAKDLKKIRQCYELMIARKTLNTEPTHSQLIRKFFSVEELIEMADKYDPEK